MPINEEENILWLISWCDRMVEKYGQPEIGVDWCRRLAYHMGEAGNDNPSSNAIYEAMKWENGPEFWPTTHNEPLTVSPEP